MTTPLENAALRLGLFVPQGWKHDLVDVAPADHWSVMSGLAQRADRSDLWESIWVFDHFHTVPEPTDQAKNRKRRGRRGGRPPGFDPERYRQRNVVERAINKLMGHRAVATRYDKRDYVFRGTVDVASIRIWLRDPSHDPRHRL